MFGEIKDWLYMMFVDIKDWLSIIKGEKKTVRAMRNSIILAKAGKFEEADLILNELIFNKVNLKIQFIRK